MIAMIALWLGTYLLHSTVLLGSLVVFFRHRLRREEGAESIWRAAVLLPVLSATAMRLSNGGLWTIGVAARPDVGVPATAAPIASSLWTMADVPSLVTVAWLLVGATLLLRDWLTPWVFVRRLGPRHAIDDARLSAVSDILRHRLLRRPVRLTYSARASSPVALGRSEICLPPRAARDLSARQFRALIAHEVAHIVRCDGRWFAALGWLESALFLQPLNRVACRELHHLAETRCDAWAARELSDPTAMALCLVEVAGWSRTRHPGSILGVAGTGGLTARVQELLDGSHPARPASPFLCTATILVSSLCLPCLVYSAPPAAGTGVRTPTLPPAFGSHSAEFIEGFEAGQRLFHGMPDARLQALLNRGRAQVSPPGQQWRAELERQLQQARGRTR